jgi:hypothetical protein
VLPHSQVFENVAGTTGLEPATSAVTGQRSNQLNYVPSITYETAKTRCVGFVSVSDTDTWVCRPASISLDACSRSPYRRCCSGRPCPAPADLHGYLLDDAAANHVADRRPAKIV